MPFAVIIGVFVAIKTQNTTEHPSKVKQKVRATKETKLAMRAFCVKADNAALIAAHLKQAESRKYCVKAGEYALVCVHNKPNAYAAAEYDALDPGRKLRSTLPIPVTNSVFAVVHLDEGLPYDEFIKKWPRQSKWALRGTAAGCPRVWNKGGNFVNRITQVQQVVGKPVIVKGKMGIFSLTAAEASSVRKGLVQTFNGSSVKQSQSKVKQSPAVANKKLKKKKPAK
eukprot:gnl/MRDRNA2_/MRDRNA2_75498_c0_seq2.p1 gnl/MRDRNA2_/MRDRNA2_75498_c0~~gnl/MRDRNA2_/MRDRNA2_75498_c0_seq2.p1  ORF type:complete len:226 (-),score=50.82 gnl/MRDRNA2_/MRDRNA2_75498_c0_seq2:111-788(-)